MIYIPPNYAGTDAVEIKLVLILVQNIRELISRPVSIGALQIELALKD